MAEFETKSQISEGASKVLEECSSRGHSQCKGTETRARSVCFRQNRKVPVDGTWWMRGNLVEDKVRKQEAG